MTYYADMMGKLPKRREARHDQAGNTLNDRFDLEKSPVLLNGTQAWCG